MTNKGEGSGRRDWRGSERENRLGMRFAKERMKKLGKTNN
jgi:hypothetical protein